MTLESLVISSRKGAADLISPRRAFFQIALAHSAGKHRIVDGAHSRLTLLR